MSLNRSPFGGRHKARRALSTDGRFSRLRRTGNWPSVDNAVPLKFCRCDVAQRRMTRFGIVVANVFENRQARLLTALEVHVVHAIHLQCTVGRFHRRVDAPQQSDLRLINTVMPGLRSAFNVR